MQEALAAQTYFIYRFQVNPNQAIAFQDWAQTRGMAFWERLSGVVRYRTFRPEPRMTHAQLLSGKPSPIDVISQVELLSREILDRIVQSAEFQRIQQELLAFVMPDSLEYSILNCAYDSEMTVASPMNQKIDGSYCK
jgi:hypothetical protein